MTKWLIYISTYCIWLYKWKIYFFRKSYTAILNWIDWKREFVQNNELFALYVFPCLHKFLTQVILYAVKSSYDFTKRFHDWWKCGLPFYIQMNSYLWSNAKIRKHRFLHINRQNKTHVNTRTYINILISKHRAKRKWMWIPLDIWRLDPTFFWHCEKRGMLENRKHVYRKRLRLYAFFGLTKPNTEAARRKELIRWVRDVLMLNSCTIVQGIQPIFITIKPIRNNRREKKR